MGIVVQDVWKQCFGEGMWPGSVVSPGKPASGARLGVAQQPAAAVRFLDDDERIVVGTEASVGPVLEAGLGEQLPRNGPDVACLPRGR